MCNLLSGHFYQFRVFAANVVGVGKPSEASEAFLCEKWTKPEPGEEKMSVHLKFTSLEIRNIEISVHTGRCQVC